MIFCSACGIRLADRARFCMSCGTAVTPAEPPSDPSAPPAPPWPPTAPALPGAQQAMRSTSVTPDSAGPLYTPIQPSPQPTYQEPSPIALPRQLIDLTQAFLSGDWKGAGLAVAVGLGSMLGLALLAKLLAGSAGDQSGSSQLIGTVAILVAMAAGGTLTASSSELGSASVSFRPLGLTFLGFILIMVIFVRRLRRHTPATALESGLQAGRLAVVLAGGLLIVSILSRAGTGAPERADIVSTMFYGVVTLAIALVPTAILALPNILPPRLEQYRVRVAGPMRAILVLTMTTCMATLIVLLLYALSWASDIGEGGQIGFWRAVFASLLLVLPNAAGAALLFGIGVPATGAFSATFGIRYPSNAHSVSILDAVGQDGRFLIWPAVIAVLMIGAGMASARRSPAGPAGRPMIVWFAGVLMLGLFVLSLNLSASIGAGGALFLSGAAGFDYLLTIVFGAIAGLLCGLVSSALTRRATQIALADTTAPNRVDR
jgi:hypothetical protein